MKNFKKIAKKLLAMIVATTIILASTTSVNAAAESIQLGDASYAGNYIAGVYFSDKKTTDGKYLYCLDMPKTTAQNVKATLVKNSKYTDGGLVYILKNGYPTKSITGDNQKDYYITQTAVWWYLDEVHGTTNLGEQFKSEGSDNYGLRKYVKNLVNEGVKHKNDSTATGTPKLKLTTNNIAMNLIDGYYKSSEISAQTENLDSYKVTLENAPAGTIIVKNGSATNYSGEFVVKAEESFTIKVPEDKVNAKTLAIKLSAKGVGNAQYKAYEYQPVDKSMQNVALLEKTAVSVTSALTLQITKEDKPVISILKVDQDTQKPLAGAVLLIKNSKGEEVYKFETKNEAEIITDITEYGTYTVEEVSAPAGYIKSNRTVSFTIDKEHPSHQITFENTKEVIVPDTANTSSVIMIILGIVLTGAGLNFVYKNRKKA